MVKKEVVIYGEKAVISFLGHRLSEVRRFFFTPRAGRRFARVCRELARLKKIYRQVSEAELQKICGSEHHGGLAVVAELPDIALLQPADLRPGGVFFGKNLVISEHIENPHNLGAIVRSAVFFGIDGFLLPAATRQVPSAAWRVAAGAMTFAVFRRAKDFFTTVSELRQSHLVVAAATRNGRSLPEANSVIGKAGRPYALLLGNEEHGLPTEMLQKCELVVTIPGSGKVESLNVSNAAAVFFAALQNK